MGDTDDTNVRGSRYSEDTTWPYRNAYSGEAMPLPANGKTGKPMFNLPSRFLVFLITFLALAGPVDARPPFGGWDLEKDVDAPTYAVAEPTSADLNIDTVVLSCEQGPDRRGLQLRLHLSGSGPLAPGMPGRLKDQPRLEIAIDGVSHRADLLFADDFVVVADSNDGAMPLLSDRLVDALQRGRRMELRFDLVQEPTGHAPDFDGTVMVELQVGRGGAAVATLRRCAADGRNQHLSGTTRGR
jgi:hypothetical protein